MTAAEQVLGQALPGFLPARVTPGPNKVQKLVGTGEVADLQRKAGQLLCPLMEIQQ